MTEPTTLPVHSFPGNLTDLSSELQEKWSKTHISHWMNAEITGKVQGPYGPRTPLTQFFDGTVTPFNTKQDTSAQVVKWTAFPNRVNIFFTTSTPARWQVADGSRIFQDEYLEWSVLRIPQDTRGSNPNTDPVVHVSMTCEGPEYWSFMAKEDRSVLVDLYQSLHKGLSQYGVQISEKDLYLEGAVYNPTNYWNLLSTSGTIAHLIQPNNTLSAEIDIAAQATVIRKDSKGNIITDYSQLLECSQYGNDYRNSDPTIGGMINNSFSQKSQSISVADPVALYIYDFNTANFMLDYNTQANTNAGKGQRDLKPVPANTFACTRGDLSKHQGLRLDIEIPPGTLANDGKTQLRVSDIYDTSTQFYIQYGAQFADYIQMSVTVVELKVTEAAAQPCPAPPASADAEARTKSVAVPASVALPATSENPAISARK